MMAWTSKYTILLLYASKPESSDVCRGCHMGTYPSDTLDERYDLTDDLGERCDAIVLEDLAKELVEITGAKLGANEVGWDWAVKGITTWGMLEEIFRGEFNALSRRTEAHGTHDAPNGAEGWLAGVHAKAAVKKADAAAAALQERAEEKAARERASARRPSAPASCRCLATAARRIEEFCHRHRRAGSAGREVGSMTGPESYP